MRVVLVEDSNVEREALARSLTLAGLNVIGEARTREEALAIIDRVAPDVVVLDLQLADGARDGGLLLAETVRERTPDIGLLVLSNYSLTPYLQRLLALPESRLGLGYVLKGGAGGLDDLVDAIRRVGTGQVYIDPILVKQLMQRSRTSDDPILTLTPAETSVLELMARGRSNPKIAQELGIKISTVERHASNIFTKLGLGSTADAQHRGFNARVMAVLAYLRHLRRHQEK